MFFLPNESFFAPLVLPNDYTVVSLRNKILWATDVRIKKFNGAKIVNQTFLFNFGAGKKIN